LPISLSLWSEEEAPSWLVWAAWTSRWSNTRNKKAQSGSKRKGRDVSFFIFAEGLLDLNTTQRTKEKKKSQKGLHLISLIFQGEGMKDHPSSSPPRWDVMDESVVFIEVMGSKEEEIT